VSDDPASKIDSAQAWSEFCELLKKAGDTILRDGLARSSFDRAEGHRYLLRLLRAGSQSFGEQMGPLYPVFRAMPELVKMGLDNPDNYYLGASISGKFTYRIRGRRGSIHYLSFAAQNQNFAARDRITGGANRSAAAACPSRRDRQCCGPGHRDRCWRRRPRLAIPGKLATSTRRGRRARSEQTHCS